MLGQHMQRAKTGFTDDRFRFIPAAPATAARGATPTGAAPRPTRCEPPPAPPAPLPRQRLRCRFIADFPANVTMKTTLHSLIAILALALGAAGCCTHRVDSPQNISFVQAMHDVGQGLAEMKAAELETLRTNSVLREQYGKTDFVTGLFPSELEITFNVSASASNANQLTVDLNAAVPQTPVSGGVGAKFSESAASARANQITIRFVSALFAKTSTITATNGRKEVVVEGIVDPEKLGAFFEAIDKHGVNKAARHETKSP